MPAWAYCPVGATWTKYGRPWPTSSATASGRARSSSACAGWPSAARSSRLMGAGSGRSPIAGQGPRSPSVSPRPPRAPHPDDDEVTAMSSDMRKTGIDAVGEMPWGTHFCLFYETKDDLLGTLVPYCHAGLEAQEFCLWVVSDPVTIDEAKHALSQAVPDLDRHLADHSLEIASARDWYLQGGTFDLK